jgi:hypothetical protein
VDLPPKLTVKQPAIAVPCHDILSFAEVSAKPPFLGLVRIRVGDMADEHLVMAHRAAVPTGPAGAGAVRAPRHRPLPRQPAADQPPSSAHPAADTIQSPARSWRHGQPCSTDQPLRHRSSKVLTRMPVRCDHSTRVNDSPFQDSTSPGGARQAGASLGDP